MSRYKGIPRYNGELDDIDPIEFGIQLRKDNKDCYDYKNIPSEKYSGGADDDPTWDFLNKWADDVQKGWRKENYRISKELFDKQFIEFKKNIPSVGDEVYLEHPNNQGKYFRCIIEFIPDEKDKVLIRYLDKKDSAYDQSPLALCTYGYSSEHKHGIFPKFYKEKPIEKDNK